jgi:hypothetical protein
MSNFKLLKFCKNIGEIFREILENFITTLSLRYTQPVCYGVLLYVNTLVPLMRFLVTSILRASYTCKQLHKICVTIYVLLYFSRLFGMVPFLLV